MQPQAPQTPSDYDFIMNSTPSPKKSLIPGAGSTKKHKIVFYGAIGLLVLIIFWIVSSVISSGNRTPSLLQIAQTQAELIRISDQGGQKLTSSTAKNLAVTTSLSMSTAQKEVLTELKKQGTKTNPKILLAAKDTRTDAALTEAAQNNRYDEAFRQILQEQLTNYQALLRTAYNESSKSTLKQILNNEYSQAGLLVASAKSS